MRPLYIIDPVTQCWVWQRGHSGKPGKEYGHIRLNGKLWTAHRLFWAIANNVMPHPTYDICHTCDNRMCVNPAHLFLGTRTDNMRDCSFKGRVPTKLTKDQVREIRAKVSAGKTRCSVAKEFSVSAALVSQIVLGRAWKHT